MWIKIVFLTDRLVNYKGVRMKIIKIFLFLLVTCGSFYAQTARELISKAENTLKGKTAYGIIEMKVVTPDYERTLKMESWWVGNEKALIVIKSPKREKGNKTLKIGNEMWNYLKNTETVIKIPPSMMLQSWNGSDFTNDDLVRESNLANDYDQKIIAEEKINGAGCWKIELIPKPDAPVVWGKIYYWVRKTDYLPALVQYFDENGKLIRYMEFSDFKKMGGRKIPTRWKMVSVVNEGHSTELKLIKMKFDIKIDDSIFSLEELERGD